MKKILALLLVALMSLSLTACGSNTAKITSTNFDMYCDVDIEYYIKNETSSKKSRTADGEVYINIKPNDPDNTKIDSISATVTANSPWSIVGGSNVKFLGSAERGWIACIYLKADSPLINTSLKLNEKYINIDFKVSGEYKK